MNDHFRLVFDVSRMALPVSMDLALLFLGPLALLAVTITAMRSRKGNAFTALIGGGFSLLVTVALLWAASNQIAEHKHLEEAARQGHSVTLSGCLDGFHPAPAEGHDNERLRLGGHVFTYSNFDMSSIAFHGVEAFGGPIHRDSKVRLVAVGDRIVRLEVQDHACPAAPDIPRSGD